MTLKDAEAWTRAQAANPPSDPYGHRVLTYAEDWATLMERGMAEGLSLEDIADPMSHVANTDGITAFMHAAAVSLLAAVWIHGEALSRWHNLQVQLQTEGTRKGTRAKASVRVKDV